MCNLKTNKKGFTLVEVIVVAVIVAVLALVGIQLYQGYVEDARLNTANNLGASAAGYLTTERNRGATDITVGIGLTGDINVTLPAGITPTTFTIPADATLDITGDVTAGGTVSATVGGASSASYTW